MCARTLTLVSCVAVTMADAFPTPDESTERMMQPLSAAASGNYTISFMPLLTVLVNMFPRLMSRVRIQPLTTTAQARKLEALWEWERTSLCSMVESAAWARLENPCYFYSCSLADDKHCGHQEGDAEKVYIDTEVVSTTQLDDCTSLNLRRCVEPTHKYNPGLASCEPMNSQERLICQHTPPPSLLYT